MKEVWKDVVGYEGDYQVSNLGRVVSFKNEKPRMLAQGNDNNRYLGVNLSMNGKAKYIRVHRLVAQAFIPNPENKPFINHIDFNGKNNKVDNLEWVTPRENTQHSKINGRFEHLEVKIEVDIEKLLKDYNDGKMLVKDVVKKYNLTTKTFYKVLNEKSEVKYKSKKPLEKEVEFIKFFKEGKKNCEVEKLMNFTPKKVSYWKKKFIKEGKL